MSLIRLPRGTAGPDLHGNKEGSNGVGTAGIVCSIIGIILGVLMLIYFIVVGAAVMEQLQNMGYYY